jgi:hypothetical protein
MPTAGFEPAIPAIKRLQSHSLDRTTIGIGKAADVNLLWSNFRIGCVSAYLIPTHTRQAEVVL